MMTQCSPEQDAMIGGACQQDAGASADDRFDRRSNERASQDMRPASEDYLRKKKKVIRRAVMWAFIFMVGVFVLSYIPIASAFSLPADVQTALTAIAIVVIGCLAGRKDMEPGWMHRSGQKMTVRAFFVVLGVFAAAKLIGMGLAVVLALPLNSLDLDGSALGDIAQKEGMEYVINGIWLGFITPFVEELVFRGLVMQRFKRYGFRFAVIASAILFAFYHSNPVQLVSAFFPGLVLGYVALRFSVRWSIVLHIINNGVIVYLLEPALAATNLPVVSTMGDYVLLVVLVIIAAVLLIGTHPIAETKAFFAQVPTEKGSYPLVFANVWFVGMAVVFLCFTALMVGMLAGMAG